MYQKEIHMIFLERKDSHKFKKDQNQKEVILELKWAYLFLPSILEVKLFIALEEDKFASIVKVQVIQQVLFIHVQFVVEAVKWLEKLRLKIQLSKLKWNANNVKEVDTLENKNALFVEEKKLLWSQEIFIMKFKKVCERVIKFFSKVNHNRDFNFILEMYI